MHAIVSISMMMMMMLRMVALHKCICIRNKGKQTKSECHLNGFVPSESGCKAISLEWSLDLVRSAELD